MHVTMVKKRTRDGEECNKCSDATSRLKARGVWDRIDEILWAAEDDAASAGSVLGRKLGVDRAPFFVVRDEDGSEQVYTSVMRLIKEKFGAEVSASEEIKAIDPDDIGGI